MSRLMIQGWQRVWGKAGGVTGLMLLQGRGPRGSSSSRVQVQHSPRPPPSPPPPGRAGPPLLLLLLLRAPHEPLMTLLLHKLVVVVGGGREVRQSVWVAGVPELQGRQQ